MYQVKITLKGIRPPIWRRVQLPGTIALATVHDVMQTVFGWTDTHLHQFHIHRTTARTATSVRRLDGRSGRLYHPARDVPLRTIPRL